MGTITTLAVVALMLLTNTHLCCARRYDNYSIYNVYPQTASDYRLLQSLDKNINLDVVFAEMPLENRIVQVLVNNDAEVQFRGKTKLFKVKIRKIARNAQKIFDDQLFQGTQFRRRSEVETIKSLEDVYKWLNKTAHGNEYAHLESIGKSAEGRDIFAFSIKVPPRPNYNNLKAIIEGSIHGNEWQSTASSLYMIEHVLNATSGPYATLKKKYFLYFIPIVNPDGYEYSQTQDRLWKKNRRKTGEDSIGVNLNRNFDYKFGEHDSSDDPHSHYYRGPYPFSEPETAALRDYIYRKRNQITFYFSLHGHGKKFILPYSDSTKHLVNYHEVQSSARHAIAKIENNRDDPRPYHVGLAHEVIGKRYSGDSASWVKKNYHVPYTVTIQLRDYNDMGIAAPNSELETSSREMSEGLTNFMISTGRYRSYEEDGAAEKNAKIVLIFFSLFLMWLNY